MTAIFFSSKLSTLRFGSRMMNVPSEPAVTEHFDMMRLCKQHEKEIRTLRQELAMHDTLTNRSQISYEPLSESQIQDVREQVKRFLAGEMNDIELVNVRQIKETFAQFRVIVNTMKADVEEKLREKYVLQERDGATSGELLSYISTFPDWRNSCVEIAFPVAVGLKFSGKNSYRMTSKELVQVDRYYPYFSKE